MKRGRRRAAAVLGGMLVGGVVGVGAGGAPVAGHTCVRILTVDIPPPPADPCPVHDLGTHDCFPLDSIVIVCVD